MKKALALLLVVCTVFCLVACGGKKDDPAANSTTPTTSSAEPTVPTTPITEPTKTPMYRQEYSEDKIEPFDQILARIGTSWESDVKLDIPVYYYDELFAYGGAYRIYHDSSYYFTILGECNNHAYEHYIHYPTNALRVRPDGSSYAVYDTEKGYRVYLLFTAGYAMHMGYPIIIKKDEKLLSYNDFKDIKVGDSIEEVISIDSITTINYNAFGSWNRGAFLTNKKQGHPLSSVHYLKDGILHIEYTKTEEMKVVISAINYNEDYLIQTADKKMTSHKIKDIDLPVT